MSKNLRIEKMFDMLPNKENARVLELGSGLSTAILTILKKYPNITYVGIEPITEHANIARENLKPYKNATIINSLAYSVPLPEQFDMCVSLSALEHVKNLKQFIELGSRNVKSGGLIVHSYDLGHALYPSNIKEKFQVFLGNHFPKILPENRFVRYVPEEEVKSLIEGTGAKVFQSTYHQMPNHKAFMKKFKVENSDEESLVRELNEWEFSISKYLGKMKILDRERLFPAVTVWAKKK